MGMIISMILDQPGAVKTKFMRREVALRGIIEKANHKNTYQFGGIGPSLTQPLAERDSHSLIQARLLDLSLFGMITGE